MIKLGIIRADGLHTHVFLAAAGFLLAMATVFLSTALFLENKQIKNLKFLLKISLILFTSGKTLISPTACSGICSN